MSVFLSSNKNIREKVIEYCKAKKKENPEFTVIDVGGFGNTWAEEIVDAYLDINPVKTNKKVYLGDINKPETWSKIAAAVPKFDFSICTHTLEDIRAPDVAIAGLQAISKSGFISMPNKHCEFSNIESIFFPGNSHHRWIFTLVNDNLRIIAKFPVVNYFQKKYSFLHKIINKIARYPQVKLNSLRIKHRLHGINFIPVIQGLDWLDPSLVGGSNELGFIWVDDFKFEFINNDFAGFNIYETANLYVNELREGL